VSADGPTGDYLAVQGNQPRGQTSAIYADVELALFHGATGQTIYTPSTSSDIPEADPTAAISADWVAFAVARPQNLGFSYKIVLYDRRTAATTVLAEVTEQQELKGKAFIAPPVIAAGKVYWLATTFAHPGATTLNSWDLSRQAPAGSVAAPYASQLISYGTGMLVAYTADGVARDLADPSRTDLRNGAGRPLTGAQLHAALHGVNFGYDGSRLSWLRYQEDSIGYTWLKVGSPDVHREPLLHGSAGLGATAFPFALAQQNLDDNLDELLDLRTRTIVTLPEGVGLQAVAGDMAIFGTGLTKGGAAGLSAVALSSLPPVRC
jgi:hypothetical protein